MKIAIIIPRLTEKGPIIMAANLAKGLLAIEGTEIVIFHFGTTSDYELKFKTIRLNFFKSYDFQDFDIVHTHMLKPDLYCVYHKINKTNKIVSTLHQFIYENLKADYNPLKAKIVEFIWLRSLRKISGIVYLNYQMKLFYENKFNSLSQKVIYNGLEFTSIQNDEPLCKEITNKIDSLKQSHYKVIGSVCLLTKRKGVDQIIRYLHTDSNLALVIIGEGKEMKALQKLAETLGISERILFTGFVSNAKLYIKYFDLFFMGSRSEGFGLSLIEAAIYKVPIVCSNISTFRELYCDNEVEFFELDDLFSLGNAIKTCLNEENNKKERLYRKVKEKFNIENMSKEYFDFYNEII